MFGLSQISRVSNSIGANLAEGCGRWGDVELARYVQILWGQLASCSITCLARDLGFLRPADYRSVLDDLTSVRQMLTAFLQKLKGVRHSQKSTSLPPPLANSE